MRSAYKHFLTVGMVAVISACFANPAPPTMEVVEKGWEQVGEASWYGPGFHGKRTSSGEVYDMEAMTAAHKQLPFGAHVQVVNLDNGRRTQVRINDRGPFARGRIIDLSRAAARDIGMLGSGTARVRLEVLDEATVAGGNSPRDPLAIPEGCFLVQVGAYQDRDNAVEMSRRLRARGETVSQVETPDGVIRVLVGPFDTAAETSLTLERYDGLLRPCDP